MRQSARNASFLVAGEAASRVFGFLTTALLARRLGVDGFGQIGFATSVLAYAVACTDLGLVPLGTRSVARSRDGVSGVTLNILPMRTLLSVGAAIVMLAVVLLVSRSSAVTGLLSVYALAVVVQGLVLEWVFIGIERMGYVSTARAISTGAYFGLVLILVRSAGSILLVPVALVVGTLIGPRFGWPRFRIDRNTWKGLFRSAWPIGAASLLTQLHVNLGIILLALVRSYHETGVYNSAYRLVFFLITLDRVFYTIFFPAASRVIALEPGRLSELTGRALRVVVALALPFCAGTLLLAGPVLQLVFGGKYLPAIPSLRILVWFLLLSMTNSVTGYTLVAAGRERRFLKNVAIGVAVSVVLNVVAVPLWGSSGAALAIVGGEAAILIAMLPDFLRLARPRLDARTAGPAVAALAMVGVILLLKHAHPLVAAGAGAAVYVAGLALTRGLTAADIGLTS
jgi:O-antigen/teichoic acid export membrane protein